MKRTGLPRASTLTLILVRRRPRERGDRLIALRPFLHRAEEEALKQLSGQAPQRANQPEREFLPKEYNMKKRSVRFSTSVFLGFLSSEVIAAEAVLGQGNISCNSWIEGRSDNNPLAATRTAWVLGFITAFNQYAAKPQRDVSGGKDTEVLMARIDDHCKRHPLDNLYKASAALVDQLRQ